MVNRHMPDLRPETVDLLLLPRFQMLAYVLATETLRIANKAATPITDGLLYRWRTITADDRPVTASNGASVTPDRPLDSHEKGLNYPTLTLVCAGYEPLAGLTRAAESLLRRRARHGMALGGLDTGTVVLAKLGLLSGYRAVVHYEAEAGAREAFPDLQLTDQIYCLDRDRLTAAGGTSTGDALLAWIAATRDPKLAEAVATAMNHGRIRPMDEPQQPTPASARGLEGAVTLMRETLEEPLAISEIAARQSLSIRAMAYRFRRAFGETPAAYYLGLRLDRARDLLAESEMSIGEIALASGFANHAWFNTAYRRRFGLPPGQHRRLLRAGTRSG